MASKSDKIDGGGHEDFKAKLAAMKAEDEVFEEGEAGKKKGGKKKKEGAPKKKQGPRKSEAEAAAQADAEVIVSVEPKVPAASAEVLPVAPSVVENSTNAPVAKDPKEADRSQSRPFDEADAEKLVQVMGFSNKEEEQPRVVLPEVKVEKQEKEYSRLRQLAQGATLEEWRRNFIERFPKLATREVQGWKGRSNLDSEAMLFIFRKIFGFAQGTDAEQAYVNPKNIEFVPPGKVAKGAFNLDTSSEKHGLWEDQEGTGGVDHHAESSARYSSAFRELYESIRGDRLLLKELSPEDELALEKLSTFVSHIDSHTVPSEIGWEKAWHFSNTTLFGITIFHQNNIQIEDIFEFFKKNNIWAAFNKDISKDPLFEKYHHVSNKDKEENGEKSNEQDTKQSKEFDIFRDQVREMRRAEDFYDLAKKRESDFVLNTPFGRLVVGLESKMPGRLLAAIAHGFDGTLVWNPEQKNFFLNTGPDKPLPADLPEKVGQGVMVRSGMFFQPSYLNEKLKLNFGQFLEKIGVDISKLPEGRISKYVKTGKWEQLKVDESKRLPYELRNPQFKKGDLVKLKDSSKLTGTRFGKSNIIGGEWIDGTNFYEIEGVVRRKFPEEEMELVAGVEKGVKPETVIPGVTSLAPTAPEALSKKPSVAESPVETKATPPVEISTASTPPSVPEAEPIVVIAPEPILENVLETTNIDAIENKYNDSRVHYVSLYKEYLQAKGRPAFIKSTWRKVKGFFGAKDLETKAGELELEEIRPLLKDAREAYIIAKSDYAKALYQQEAARLARIGKSEEDIAEELKQFGHDKIFQTLIIGEEKYLQTISTAEWPPLEKGILRKGLEKWVKLPLIFRMAISTGVVTGGLYAFGAIGAGAVAGTAAWRLGRGLFGAAVGQAMGHGAEKLLRYDIKKADEKKTEVLDRKFADLISSGDLIGLDRLSEKYHKIFEEKAKAERRKLFLKAGVIIASGLGASIGLGALIEHMGGTGAIAEAKSGSKIAPEGSVKPTASTMPNLQEKIEMAAAEAKANNTDLIEAMQKQVDTARLEELATLQKGEGIIHVVSRQLEDDPLRFGYSGSLEDVQATHEWARHLAGEISIKDGYWDPSQQAQKWFVYNPAKPMHFVLSGDAEKGFHIDQSGEARSFIHTGDTKVLPQEKYPDWDEGKVPTDQPSAPTEVAPTEPIAPEYSGRPLQWETWTEPVRGHMHMLAEELKASHELAQQYGTDPNLHPAALAVEHDVLKKIVEYQNAIKAHDVSGYDQALKEGVSWDDYHETVKSELDKEVWKHAASHAGSGGGATRVESVVAPAPEVPAGGQATSATAEAVKLARIFKDQYLNTSLSTADRIDALKELMFGHNLKLDNISYHQAGQGVRVEIGDYNGWVDDKNIDILKEFHKQFKGIATPGTDATAKLVEKLQAATKK